MIEYELTAPAIYETLAMQAKKENRRELFMKYLTGYVSRCHHELKMVGYKKGKIICVKKEGLND